MCGASLAALHQSGQVELLADSLVQPLAAVEVVFLWHHSRRGRGRGKRPSWHHDPQCDWLPTAVNGAAAKPPPSLAKHRYQSTEGQVGSCAARGRGC